MFCFLKGMCSQWKIPEHGSSTCNGSRSCVRFLNWYDVFASYNSVGSGPVFNLTVWWIAAFLSFPFVWHTKDYCTGRKVSCKSQSVRCEAIWSCQCVSINLFNFICIGKNYKKHYKICRHCFVLPGMLVFGCVNQITLSVSNI